MLWRSIYLDKLWAHRDKPLIKVLTGMRRCGKSTVLAMYHQRLLASGVTPEQIVSMNFESGAFLDIINSADLYRYIKARAPKDQKLYLLLDEVQIVDGWEKAVNAVRVDFDADITLTGSNAYLLSSELSTLLSGRYVEIEIFPLSFAEYLFFTHELHPGRAAQPQEALFDQYINTGGLPVLFAYDLDEALLSQVMDGLYSTIIRKDVLFRNQVGDAQLLDRVAAFLTDNIGGLVSSGKIADTFRSGGIRTTHNTILNYIDMLRSAYIFYQVKRFDIKGKEHLKTLDKYYLCDLGLRRAVLGRRETDMGRLLENIVFLELRRRGYRVSVGMLGAFEVDFVAENPKNRYYIQVTHSLQLPEVRERELRPLQLIKDGYPKMIITRDRALTGDIEGIRIVNALDFLLADDDRAILG